MFRDLKFDDMTVNACMKRYMATRERTLERIRSGQVSASMSGIEYHPKVENMVEQDIRVALCWDGTAYVDRPDFMAEFEEWKRANT